MASGSAGQQSQNPINDILLVIPQNNGLGAAAEPENTTRAEGPCISDGGSFIDVGGGSVIDVGGGSDGDNGSVIVNGGDSAVVNVVNGGDSDVVNGGIAIRTTTITDKRAGVSGGSAINGGHAVNEGAGPRGEGKHFAIGPYRQRRSRIPGRAPARPSGRSRIRRRVAAHNGNLKIVGSPGNNVGNLNHGGPHKFAAIHAPVAAGPKSPLLEVEGVAFRQRLKGRNKEPPGGEAGRISTIKKARPQVGRVANLKQLARAKLRIEPPMQGHVDPGRHIPDNRIYSYI